VAGHAGLFGLARGVARFGESVLDGLRGRSSFLAPERLREVLPAEQAQGWGFVRRSAQTDGSWWGKRVSEGSFGQVGFTGASLLIDPRVDAVLVLLSNRVCPSRANTKIDGFRPAFHDGVLAALGAR